LFTLPRELPQDRTLKILFPLLLIFFPTASATTLARPLTCQKNVPDTTGFFLFLPQSNPAGKLQFWRCILTDVGGLERMELLAYVPAVLDFQLVHSEKSAARCRVSFTSEKLLVFGMPCWMLAIFRRVPRWKGANVP
jgi:hypothetical protein